MFESNTALNFDNTSYAYEYESFVSTNALHFGRVALVKLFKIYMTINCI